MTVRTIDRYQPGEGKFPDDSTIEEMEREFPHRGDVVSGIGVLGTEVAASEPPYVDNFGNPSITDNHPGSTYDKEFSETEEAMRKALGLGM